MGRVVAGETSTTMKVLAILFLATLAYAAPEAEPKADADAAADAWYAYYGHPYRYYGYGGYYGGWRGYYGGYYGYPGYYGYRGWWKRDAEAMPNPKLMPRPTPPSFTPMLTVTPLSILMDTLTDTPALTTLMLITMLPLSIPLLL